VKVCQGVRVLECRRVRLSDCQSFRLSECQIVRVSECQSVRVSECQIVRVSECQSVKVSECQSGVNWRWGESELSKMFTFTKMVITGVENGSPDMILVAFERKFDE
jgi:hypothetical protein